MTNTPITPEVDKALRDLAASYEIQLGALTNPMNINTALAVLARSAQIAREESRTIIASLIAKGIVIAVKEPPTTL